MAGWRVGFVVGKKEFIDTIFAMKINIDYGTSSIIQDAAIAALEMPYEHVEATINQYQKRRDFLVSAFKNFGWAIENPKATMYLWLKVPNGLKSKEFCKMIMDKVGVVFTPGIAFGDYADDYFRVSLVQPIEKLEEAIKRLEDANIHYEE